MSPRAVAARTFSSLKVRNYRLYFGGQLVSMTGTWMQWVAQAWLVLRLTGSGFAIGAVTALQFLPMLLGGAYGGVLADRVDKRRLIVATQSTAGGLALLLGLLVVTGVVQLWMVFALAFALGVVTAVDNPARQAFVTEMVGREDVTNAVSLNSVLANATRVVGPAVAGFLIASVGIGVCFLINAASYIAVVASLLRMRRQDLEAVVPAERTPGQLREGLRYVRARPDLWLPLSLMVVVAAIGYNFSVVLPLLSRFTFHHGAAGYGVLFSVMSVGAVISGLTFATLGRTTARIAATAALAFGLLLMVAAVMPTFGAEMLAMVAVGGASTIFVAATNSLLQLRTDPAYRGRVVALFAIAFLGTTPIGAPLVGWIGGHFGPRMAFGFGALVSTAAALTALALLARVDRSQSPRYPVSTRVPRVLTET
ncbi:MAG: MFS transporter [Actinomycetota bacterium]